MPRRMPSLGRYCQGMIRYRAACQASIILCKEKGLRLASDRSCPRVARQQQFEDLLNSLVCWRLKLICFKVYSTHWSCKGSSSTRAFPAQLKTWLSYKAYITLQMFELIVLNCCWVLFIQNHKFSHEIRFVNIQFMNEFITDIWIMILLNSLQYIHMPYFTTELNIMNSEHWILIYFQ